MTDILIGRNEHFAVRLDPRYGNHHGMIETMGKQVIRSMDGQLGRPIRRGMPGGSIGGKSKR